MFVRGISDEFATALSKSPQWGEISPDPDLFLAMRNEYVNVYYRGCSIFKISYKNDQLRFETHYKYLIHPHMEKPYIMWRDAGNAIEERIDKNHKDKGIFVDSLDTELLKTAASYYAGAEKKGVHKILQSNGNIIDVEIALSSDAEKKQDVEDEIDAGDESKDLKTHADRIDFVALQRIDGCARVVFFEAKRLKNPELWTSAKGITHQIERYEGLLAKEKEHIENSYLKVCKNLYHLAPKRWGNLVEDVAKGRIKLDVDPKVRLVVFDYDAGQRDGVLEELKARLGGTLILSKGDPKGLIQGISRYNSETNA